MINWKEYLAKYFTNLVSILTLAGMVFLGFRTYKAEIRADEERKLLEARYGKLIDTTKQYEQLTEYSGQLATLYKKQAELQKELAVAWQDLAIERQERIKLVGETVINVDESTVTQNGPDYTFKTPEGTQDYTLNELRLEGENSPPIGYIMTKNDGTIYKKNYRFEVRVESAQLKDDLTGEIRVVSRAFLVPLENGLAEKRRPDLKKWEGEKYPLKVVGGEVVVDPQEPIMPEIKTKGWVYWANNLNGGFGLFGTEEGALDTKATVDTNFMGYGYSKQDLDWKLLHFGVNYSQHGGLGFHAMPFSYRPFPEALTNTYLGPGAYITPDEYGYFIGLNIGF